MQKILGIKTAGGHFMNGIGKFVAPASCRLARGRPARARGGEDAATTAAGAAALQDDADRWDESGGSRRRFQCAAGRRGVSEGSVRTNSVRLSFG